METIDLCCDLWKCNSGEHDSLDEFAFRELLTFATSNVHFCV